MPSSRGVDMGAGSGFIRRIVSRAGIMTPAARRDMEEELDAHLEDAWEEARAQGQDEADIRRLICERFGDPDEIARELRMARRLERRALAAAFALALLGIS